MTDWDGPEEPPEGDEDPRTDGSSFTRRLMELGGDVVSRALVTGVSAVFMTEEGIRSAMTDLRLPKEVARGLVQQADATKREMFRIIGREVRTFLEQSNMSAAVARALADTTVEVHTTIRFRPNQAGGVTPEVRASYGVMERPEETAEGEGDDAQDDDG